MQLAIFFVLTCPLLFSQAIQTNPVNPHYFLFHGKPTVLITSAEHYGAVINTAFDYVPYLDALKEHGMNYTRIYPGAMIESTDKWVSANPLGPAPKDLIVPWERSNVPGYMNGGNKFDLTKWNPQYFARLKDFLAKAAERGIVVEICFFNSQYSDTWVISPLYYQNNIQGTGKCEWRQAQVLGCGDLEDREKEYVRKITREVNSFDNVILEICDECASVGSGVVTGPWVSSMLDAARNEESSLPQKHLIAQEVEGPYFGPMDFSADPRISIITAQYLYGDEPSARGGEMGGFRGLDNKYGLNKPIEVNETAWYGAWGYSGAEDNPIADSRVEAWEFIVGGGAGYNHLNSLYTPANPAGKSPENEQILGALYHLKMFIENFDFLKMRPDKAFVVGGLTSPRVHYRGLSDPGKQYALYIHHSDISHGGWYTVVAGKYQEDLIVSLPPGKYNVDWIDPAKGVKIGNETFQHLGGNRMISTPTYSIDIALRIKQIGS